MTSQAFRRNSPVSPTASATVEPSTTESTSSEATSVETSSSMESTHPVPTAKTSHGMVVEAASNRRRTRSVEVVIAAEAAVVRRVPRHQW